MKVGQHHWSHRCWYQQAASINNQPIIYGQVLPHVPKVSISLWQLTAVVWKAMGDDVVYLLIIWVLGGFLTQLMQSGTVMLITMKESYFCD